MDFRTYENRLEYLLDMIQKKRMPSLEVVSDRFGCSTRTIKRMINHLREQDHPIFYDRQQKKYLIKESE